MPRVVKDAGVPLQRRVHGEPRDAWYSGPGTHLKQNVDCEPQDPYQVPQTGLQRPLLLFGPHNLQQFLVSDGNDAALECSRELDRAKAAEKGGLGV